MQTSDFYSARVPRTRGSCGHRHMDEVTRDHCQGALNNRFSKRLARKAAALGGGKKRGCKAGKQRKTRSN